MTADACVIGLGGSGLAAIDEFLALGWSVAGIDAGAVASRAAGRNGGLLRAGGARFHHVARDSWGADCARWIYQATAAERERLLTRFPALARRTGYLRLAVDDLEVDDCRAHLAALRSDGVPATWYRGTLGQGLLVPDDAAIDPLARCRAEALRATAGGARLFEHSPAERISAGLVECREGEVRCRVVVAAVDGGLDGLFPELRGRIRPVRLQMLASAGHEAVAVPHAIASRWGWDYGQQLPDGRIAFGGCRDADDGADGASLAEPTDVVQAAIERRFGEVFGVPAEVTHRWAAIVGYTADGLPVTEQVRDGVWATGAYSGTGNLLGAVCARLLARMAAGHPVAPPWAPSG